MMLPRPRSSIPGTSCATRKYAPRTLVSNIASNDVTSWSTVNAEGKLAALLTRMSMSPTSRASHFTDSRSDRSAGMNTTLPSMSAAAWLPRRGVSARDYRCALERDSRAEANPMPAVPPVTKAVWFSSSIVFVAFLPRRGCRPVTS